MIKSTQSLLLLNWNYAGWRDEILTMMPVETEETLPKETVRIPEEQDIRIRPEEMEQILSEAVLQVS